MLNNRTFQTRPTVVKINFKEPFLYLFVVSVNTFGASFSSIDHPYNQAWAIDKAKNMNINVFNLISSVNETNFSVQHESRECKCR